MALLSLVASIPGIQYILLIAIFCAAGIRFGIYRSPRSENTYKSPEKSLAGGAPVSVNYFPSRKCNYTCGFCFHTETSSYVLPVDQVKHGLRLLKEAGMRKLNIAGGEPFLYPALLTHILRYGKEELGLESISIVSNGSKIREKWMRDNAQWLDILAVSCDSFNPETNIRIGRGDDGGNADRLLRISTWCKTYGVKFKLNTVVNTHNWDEDMAARVEQVAPFRWKAFQCLIVAGENDDETRKRDARDFLVTDEQWRTFCNRHKHLSCFIPEDNQAMAGSYLNLDEYMCFLDKGEGVLTKSESILKVGVQEALKNVVWDKKSFVERGGIYDWGRSNKSEVGCASNTDMRGLDW